MGNAKAEKEELKKLEDEAYFELCQIIAEAMQEQSIELLDYRIASWKYKYKKLLDNPSPNFKKRIEYLLTEYYSSVTQYIQSQIKFNENKKIENQSKALRELYIIIKNTNDLKLLEKKVNAWKEKYPKDKFLKMYQSKYEHMTSKRNLRENSFDQEMAFKDLIEITKHTGTFEEFSREREEWEKKYSIHDKFELDDFIKHQSEVKRYTSDEYLHSISREEEKKEDSINVEVDSPNEPEQKEHQEKQPQEIYSDLAKQAAAYSALVTISQKPKNVDEMFKWVYKNSSIKFNDKYKELILNATYLDYSPTYLKNLKTPDLNINNKSLSYEEFKEMDDIKKYAIISYFNLLLPPDKAISNNFFNACISTVYTKSEKAKYANNSLNEIKQENLIDGIEIKLSKSDAEKEINIPEIKNQNIPNVDKREFPSSSSEEIKAKQTDPAEKLQEFAPNEPEQKKSGKENEEKIIVAVSPVLASLAEEESKADEQVLPHPIETEPEKQEIKVENKENENTVINSEIEEEKGIIIDLETEKEPVKNENNDNINLVYDVLEEQENITEPIKNPEITESKPLQQKEIITVSPLFFSVINNKDKQAQIVKNIDNHVDEYVLSVPKTNSDHIQTKQKND